MEIEAEKITPYDHTRSKTEQVKDMFDSIAPAYDFMNRMMTLGIDRLWRAKAVKMLKTAPHRDILDVATGTGDLAMMLMDKLNPESLTGIDLSRNMIDRAITKAKNAGLERRMTFQVADCLALPFEASSFDCVTVAYGVRNFEHLDQGYKEMFRVLRPGGALCVIELSTPTSPLVRPFYKLYTRHIIPLVGRCVSHDVRAYSYLPESIAAVPQGDRMLSLMKDAGFSECSFHPLTFGVCTIYIARK